ncbi:hypothetical protein Q8A73_021577 [Channa argus]|nr:hypothetical protein Q8A73_021577 [Channa argus]
MAGRPTPTQIRRHAEAAPQRHGHYYRPGSYPEEEVGSLRRRLHKARQHNEDLQNQVSSLVQEVEKLKNDNAVACYEANSAKDNVCRLEVILEAKDMEFNAEQQKLNESIKLSESKVSDLAQRLQLEEEKTKVSNLHIKNNYDIMKEHREKINELVNLLSQKQTRNLQLRKEKERLTKQLREKALLLQNKETENKKNKKNWQKTKRCLQEQMSKLSEKYWNWEKRWKNMEEEVKRLQQEKTRLVEEKRKMDNDKSALVEEKTNLERQNAHLKEEKAELVKERNKLVEENKNLAQDRKNLQVKIPKLVADKKKHGEYITELEDLCMKMHRRRKGFWFHRHNKVDTVAAVLEKDRSKREKQEKKIQKEKEKEAQRTTEKEGMTRLWCWTHAKQKCDDQVEEVAIGSQ